MVLITCWKPRLSEYGLRVRLTSVGDGVPQGVEYRSPVEARSDAGPASYEGAQLVKIVSISQDYYETLQRIIDSNTKRIVSECQAYLDLYEREGRPRFAVDIDRIVGLLEGGK